MKKEARVAVLTLTLIAPVAVPAQTQTPPALDPANLRELEDIVVERLGISAGRAEGMTVVGPDGVEIGEVEEILVGENMVVQAFAVQVGGFLGVGSREAVVSIELLGLSEDGDSLVSAVTREQVALLPEWND